MKATFNKPLVRARLAALGCAGAAIAIGWWIAPEIVRGVQSLDWPTVEGTLLSSSRDWDVVVTGGSRGRSVVQSLDLSYAYTFQGPSGQPAHHVGWAFDASTPTGSTRHAYSIALKGMAQEAMRAAPAVTVHCDPAHPERSLLRPGVPFGTTLVLMAMLACAGASWLLWRGGEARTRGLVPWTILFPVVGMVLAATLVGLYRHLGGCVPPGWTMLAYELVCTIALLRPPWVRWRPLRDAIWFAMLAFPVAGIWALVLAIGETSSEVVYEPSDAVIVQQLFAPHPAVAEHAAWTVRDRRGPATAIEGLGHCLESPELAVRRAAIAAIEKLGAVAKELAGQLDRVAREDPDERARGFAAQARRRLQD